MSNTDKQITFEEYIKSRNETAIGYCGLCICRSCLYWWSGRCPHGKCFDDKRAKTDPYDKAHPDRPLRKGWSDWNKPGEQEHWCRGGIFYTAHYCEEFEEYEGSTMEECIACNIQIFQDGYIRCTFIDTIGCDACIDQYGIQERIERYGCQYMTETGCEQHINALTAMAQDILQGNENMEMCGEQCCIGCTKNCNYRCGVVKKEQNNERITYRLRPHGRRSRHKCREERTCKQS